MCLSIYIFLVIWKLMFNVEHVQKQNTCNLMEIKMATEVLLACLVMLQSPNLITYSFSVVPRKKVERCLY